jgi:glycosyltransferase involved in cell wall biosynthesis
MPFFSVVIPTHNRAEPLRRAVDSVLAQTFRDFELIVVDDGSGDTTHLLKEEYFSRLSYFYQENRGVSAARNLGIRMSSSPYITLLDSDDTWLPGKLEAHRAFLAERPDIRLHQTDERWIRRGRDANPMKKHAKPEGDIFLTSLRLCLVSPSCACLDRALFDEYGLFDEKLPACEDYDLWLRMTWREKAGLIRDKLTVKYGGHDDQLSRRFWGMDRFRVYSICSLLGARGNEMPAPYREEAVRVAREKCSILMEGARRRGRDGFAREAEEVIGWLDRGSCSSRDFGRLLEE